MDFQKIKMTALIDHFKLAARKFSFLCLILVMKLCSTRQMSPFLLYPYVKTI